MEIAKELNEFARSLTSVASTIGNTENIDDIVDGRTVQISQVLRVLSLLLERIDSRLVSAFGGLLGTYMTDVIEVRNVYAHGKTSSCGTYIELGEKKVGLSDKDTRDFKALLKRHKSNLSALLQAIRAKEEIKNQAPPGSAPDTAES